jgi:hypothetical protein
MSDSASVPTADASAVVESAIAALGGAAAAPVAADAAPPSAERLELLRKLKKQMEYYFSDANFRKDKYLRTKAAEDADGFVTLDEFLKFNKIKALIDNPADLSAALEDSEPLELSEDRAAVRRAKPLPEDDDSEVRSVYVKGPFPAETSLEALHEWAAAEGGPVARVSMRRTRNKEKTFRGSAFFEFLALESATALLQKFAAGGLKFLSVPVLKTEPLKEYGARKKAEREARKAAKGAGGGGGGGGGGKQKSGGKATGVAAAASGGGGGGGGGSEPVVKPRPRRDAAETVEEDDGAAAGGEVKRVFKKHFVPNVILRVTEMGQRDVDVKGKLQLFLNASTGNQLTFLEYKTEEKIAFARFKSAEACAAAKAAIEEGGPNMKEATGADKPVPEILQGALLYRPPTTSFSFPPFFLLTPHSNHASRRYRGGGLLGEQCECKPGKGVSKGRGARPWRRLRGPGRRPRARRQPRRRPRPRRRLWRRPRARRWLWRRRRGRQAAARGRRRGGRRRRRGRTCQKGRCRVRWEGGGGRWGRGGGAA